MATFEAAIQTILNNEGGYTCNPADPGGETNFGISRRAYPALDIKNLTRDQAAAIYHTDYWRYSAINDQELATKLLDIGVNQGTLVAVELLQRVVGVEVDGRLGPATVAAVNAGDAVAILKQLRAASIRRRFVMVEHNQSLAQFLEGWCVRDAQ